MIILRRHGFQKALSLWDLQHIARHYVSLYFSQILFFYYCFYLFVFLKFLQVFLLWNAYCFIGFLQIVGFVYWFYLWTWVNLRYSTLFRLIFNNTNLSGEQWLTLREIKICKILLSKRLHDNPRTPGRGYNLWLCFLKFEMIKIRIGLGILSISHL